MTATAAPSWTARAWTRSATTRRGRQARLRSGRLLPWTRAPYGHRLLKFFELEARFPRHAGEVPRAAVDYLAGQVKVDPALFASYAWTGRTIAYHRAQVRRVLGFREASRADEEKLVFWLATEVAPVELSDERLREALLAVAASSAWSRPAAWSASCGGSRRGAERFCAATVARSEAPRSGPCHQPQGSAADMRWTGLLTAARPVLWTLR